MVSFYSPKAISVLRDYLGPSQASSQYKPKHQLLVPHTMIEAPPGRFDTRKLLNWLYLLPPTRLEGLVTIQDAELVLKFTQLYDKLLMLGNFKFSYSAQKDSELFSIHKLKSNPTNAEKKFLQAVRLSDTEQYLDTLTLDSELLQNPAILIDYMSQVSCGQAFRTSLHIIDGVLESPPKTRSSRFTLAHFLSLALEIKLWQEFWKNQDYHKPQSLWPQFQTYNRLQILENRSYWKKEFRAIQNQLQSSTMQIVKKTQGAKAEYQRPESLISLYNFIESQPWGHIENFLTLSTLDRAGTPLDVIARIVYSRITQSKVEIESRRRKKRDSIGTSASSSPDCSFIKDLVYDLINAAIPKRKRRRGPKKNRLHKEIIDFVQAVETKTSQRLPVLSAIIHQIGGIICLLYPGAQLSLFGSYATGLATSGSDLDLQITHQSYISRAHIQTALFGLHGYFQMFPWITGLQCISQATIPVLKMDVLMGAFSGHTNDGIISVDLTFNDSMAGGTHMGGLTLNTSKHLLSLHPQAKYLMFVLKTLLGVHQLNSTYRGGLSGYSLLIWVVAYINSLSYVPEDYGQLLINFLGYYGKQFEVGRQGICAQGFFESSDTTVLTIDPSCASNNTTRSSYNVKEVFALFRNVHTMVCSRKNTSQLLAVILKSK